MRVAVPRSEVGQVSEGGWMGVSGMWVTYYGRQGVSKVQRKLVRRYLR